MLSDLAFGKTVAARVTEVDLYGRSVSVITRGEPNINAEMVRRGGAWAYWRYLPDQRYIRWAADPECQSARKVPPNPRRTVSHLRDGPSR